MSYMKQMFEEKDGEIDNLQELIKYRYAYDILMEYFDSIPEEDKPEIHKRLEGLGL